MNPSIIEDPLFQLNLILFASIYSPAGARIIPVFHRAGYSIYKISPKVSVPPTVSNRLQAIPTGVPNSAKPEVLLRNSQSGKVTIVECKRNSFSSTSTTARQASGYLVLTDDILRDALAEPRHEKWTTDLLYFVTCNGDNEHLLNECLKELSGHINDVGVNSNPFGVCGIEQKDDGVYFNFEYAPCMEEFGVQRKVLSTQGEEDFRTLYLIPADVGIRQLDDYSKTVITNRIRSSFIALLMRSLPGKSTLVLSIEELLQRSLLLWDIWEDTDTKREIRSVAREVARKELKSIKKKLHIEFREDVHSFNIGPVEPKMLPRLTRYFTGGAYFEFPGQQNLGLDN